MNLQKSMSTMGLAVALGLGLASVGVQAQDGYASSGGQQTVSSPNGDLTAQVKQALHSNPGLDDKHIVVSMEKGKVVLNGFVSSAQDLQKAIRAANDAVGEHRVVNNLTIKEGGGGGSG
jgi:osmotically-inducible protein OsmY